MLTKTAMSSEKWYGKTALRMGGNALVLKKVKFEAVMTEH